MTIPPTTTESTKKRNRSIGITVIIFITLGLIWGIYWWSYARFYKYTTDAYVDGNLVMVTPRITETVLSFSAIDGDFVTKGRILVELDREDAKISLERNSATLANSVREVAKLFENAQRDAALIEEKKAEFIKSAQDYEHRKGLVEEGGVSLEDFEHSQAALAQSFFSLNAVEHQYIASAAQVENTTITSHPLVETAKSQLRDAYLFYQRCTIKAPVSGIVAQRTLEVGQLVKIGQPLMAIVPLDQLWVTANFKEDQLSRVRIGQPVSIQSDIYGSGVVFKGVVAGIGGGTGSVFSVLPPQNATGNWIKIIQRVPIRIALDQELIKLYPLRLGLSTEVTIDTHDTQKPYVPLQQATTPLFETDIFETQEVGVEAMIEQIILDNLPTL